MNANANNNYPEQNYLYKPEKQQKVMPGQGSYRDITKDGKKTCIISDSIAQRINMKYIKRNVKTGNIFKKIYPGSTAEEIKHNMIKVLELNPTLDRVILQVGSNNVHNRYASQTTDFDITNTIIKTVELCHRSGVNEVYVAGITCRPGYIQKVNNINDLLKRNATGMGYVFINNDNILPDKHLWDDQLHLNKDGLSILEDNFINILNKR